MIYDEKDDMSIEDILASIRKYVAEDDSKTEQVEDDEQSVIHLTKEQVAENVDEFSEKDQTNATDVKAVEHTSSPTAKPHEEQQRKSSNPFSKLASAIVERKKPEHHAKSGIDEWLEEIVRNEIGKWLDNNLQYIVESEVNKQVTLEINRIKNSNE